MPFVDRNVTGDIIGVYTNRQYTDQEYVESATLWVNNRAQIQKQIDELEYKTLMNRTVREDFLQRYTEKAMQTYGVDEATAVAGLYAGNIAFRKFKDTDDQIKALRALL